MEKYTIKNLRLREAKNTVRKAIKNGGITEEWAPYMMLQLLLDGEDVDLDYVHKTGIRLKKKIEQGELTFEGINWNRRMRTFLTINPHQKAYRHEVSLDGLLENKTDQLCAQEDYRVADIEDLDLAVPADVWGRSQEETVVIHDEYVRVNKAWDRRAFSCSLQEAIDLEWPGEGASWGEKQDYKNTKKMLDRFKEEMRSGSSLERGEGVARG